MHSLQPRHTHTRLHQQASFPCPGHHLIKSLSLLLVLSITLLFPNLCGAPPPHHTPTVGGIPRATLLEQLPTSPAGFVLRLSFQEQARGSAQKTLISGPLLSPIFPRMARGQLLARYRKVEGRTGLEGTTRVLERLRGAQHRRARSHFKGARSACTRRAPRTRAPGGIPGLSGTRGSCHGPIALPTQAMSGRNTTPGTTSLGDSTPGPHSFTQTAHPNHSPRGAPKCIPGYCCPSQLSLGAGIPARPLCTRDLHGSIQSRKTNRNSLTSLRRGLGLCYAARGRSSMGSIPGVHAGHRALPDGCWGPAVACSSRRGLRSGAGRVAAAPPAAQFPGRPRLGFRRRLPPAPPPPSQSRIGHLPPGAGHRAGAFCVTPKTQALKGAGG